MLKFLISNKSKSKLSKTEKESFTSEICDLATQYNKLNVSLGVGKVYIYASDNAIERVGEIPFTAPDEIWQDKILKYIERKVKLYVHNYGDLSTDGTTSSILDRFRNLRSLTHILTKRCNSYLLEDIIHSLRPDCDWTNVFFIRNDILHKYVARPYSSKQYTSAREKLSDPNKTLQFSVEIGRCFKGLDDSSVMIILNKDVDYDLEHSIYVTPRNRIGDHTTFDVRMKGTDSEMLRRFFLAEVERMNLVSDKEQELFKKIERAEEDMIGTGNDYCEAVTNAVIAQRLAEAEPANRISA